VLAVLEAQATHTPKLVSPSHEGRFARSGAAAGDSGCCDWFGGAAGSSVQEILDAANGSVALLAVVSCMSSSTAMTTPNKNQHGEKLGT
jgi:hypothetical protein